jgi:hypothetical protein
MPANGRWDLTQRLKVNSTSCYTANRYTFIDPKYIYYLISTTCISRLSHLQGCHEILQEDRDAKKLSKKCICDNMNVYLLGYYLTTFECEVEGTAELAPHVCLIYKR